MKRLSSFCALSLLLTSIFALSAFAQITPSDDAYVNSAAPTANYGAATTLNLSSAADTGFIRFDLTAVPAGYTGSSVAKATLKLYVNSVTTAGSFNVDYVSGTWAEQTIKYDLQPAIGTTIASGVPLTTGSKGKYVEIDLTAAVVEWLNGTQANDGIALVADSPLVATFDSKENTGASHPPELDVVYAGIAGVTTGSGSGLTGGGTSGTLNLSLITSCAANQVLQWNGTAWVCANTKGSGTITGVTAGADLTGGGTSGNVKLNLDTTKVPQLATANTFVGNQSVTGNLGVASSAFQPVTVQSSNSFGTWLALGNTSSGGHTWNIVSAGGGNAEGAGNLGISDLTGKSTIWLEGNANVSGTLSATNVNVSGTLQTASVGGSVVDADISGTNSGSPTPGVQFGGTASGETIASNRVAGINRFGLDFYTNSTPRISILNYGLVGIGTTHPVYQLEVDSGSNGYAAIFAQGGAAPNGSGQNGSDGIDAYGNSGDLTSGSNVGGNGISAFGNSGNTEGGLGGEFVGGEPYGYGIWAIGGGNSPDSYAGFFNGPIFVAGSIVNPSVITKIDHPLDPANKYLSHSSVESPDMKNMYDGVVVTDANGDAIVPLPEWFEALNRDFRYQLTVIGQFAQAIVTGEVASHQFSIKTDKPGVKVSWQVTGIRQDAWANAHRTPVEEEKNARDRGHYLHPELYGAPEEASIAWARHPGMMKHIKEMREKQSSPHASTARKSGPAASAMR